MIGAVVSTQGQSVFNPNDPIVIYNPSNPPTEPVFGQPGKWVKKNRVNWNTSSFKAYIYKGIQFRLKWPKNYDASGNTKYPLFVFFHGRGEWGDKYDNEYQLYHGGELHKNAVDNGLFNGFLLYPQSTNPDETWLSEQRRFVMELIEDFLISQLQIDPFRISVDGLSAGGLATWKFFQSYPKLVAACLPISNASSSFGSIVVDNKFTPIWLFQGALDQNPKPVSAQYLKTVAENAGGNLTYTEYPNQGHGCWYSAWGEPDYFPFLNRANKANPWPLYGRTEFCNTGPGSVNTTIGVTSGFDEYQWRKNDVLLTGLGTSSNTLTVTDIGVYSCRIRKGTTWSEWSPIPVEIKYKTSTIPPVIKVSGLASRVLPAPDGKTTVNLEVPAIYSAYNWQKAEDPANAPPLSTGNVLNGAAVGDYKVQVTEQFGCSGAFTEPFSVINANGPNKPDPASSLIVVPLSYTSLKLNWSSNPNPAYPQTNFEIYQAAKAGGPYQFISLVDGNVFSFVKEGLTPGVKYYFIVRAVNNTAAAPVSNEAFATTQKDTNPPTAPGNLHVTGSTRDYISVAWGESTDDVGIDYYEVYVNGAKSYVTSETEFIVYGLDYGMPYNFTIKAVDIAGNKSAPSNQVTAQPLAKGLTFKHYTGSWDVLPDFNLLTPISTGVVPNVTLANASQAENYAFLWEGYIRIPYSGNYTFRTNSDDGSKLYLSSYNHTATALVNNDGLHGSQNANGSITLTAGVYPIAITFFQKGGGANMNISWQRSGLLNSWSMAAIPDSAFVEPPLLPAGSVPAKPSNLAATAVSFKQINLNWSDNSNNEKSFELYRSTDPLDGFITIGALPANATSFADTLVEPSTTYYYKIRAINQYGESAFDKIGPGVDYAYYERTGMTEVPNFNNMTPVKSGRVGTFSLGMQLQANNFALKFDGLITIPATGNYTFYLRSDDGSRLYIDGSQVVNNDGSHNANNEISGSVNLNAGIHDIRVTYFEGTGDEVLNVSYSGPGINKQNIPEAVLGDVLANATTLPAPPAPAIPSNLKATGISSSNIKVSWTNNATNATSIEVYRSYNGNADYVLLTTLPANNTSFNDVGLYPSSLFYYKVRAVGEGGASGYSNEQSTRTLGILPSLLPIENVYMRFNSYVELPIEAISGSPVDITLSVSNLPSFAVFTQTGNGKGIIAFSPSENDQGLYSNIVVTAANPQNNINTAKFNLTVNSNYVPVINTIANVTVNEKQTAQINISGVDQDADDYLSWAFTGLPGFATMATTSNRNVAVTFNPQYGDAGVYDIKAHVKDGRNGKDTASFKLTVVHVDVPNPNDGTAPVKPKDVAVQYVSAVNAVQVTWTNMAYNATGFEIYRSTTLTGYYTLLNPAPTNKDSTSYYDYTAVGNTTYFYAVRAINADGGANSAFIKIITPNKAPVITSSDIYLKSSTVLDVNIVVTDDPGDNISLSVLNLPSFASFTDNGNGIGSLHLAPTGTHVGVSSIIVNAIDSYGAESSKTIKINVADKYIKSVYVNFNNKDYPVNDLPWNSFNAVNVGGSQVAKLTAISNLRDETGGATTIDVKLMESWPQYYLGSITGNDSGIFSDSVIKTGYYFYVKETVPQKTIKISGLNTAKKYNLICFGNLNFGSEQITQYVAGGQTASLNTINNTSNTAQINGLTPNAQGEIDLVVKSTLNRYAIISALVIQEYDNSIGFAPINLNMASSTKSSIKLSWKYTSDNATGFEVWRSDTPDGTYEKLPASIPGNVFTYTDMGLAKGTVYYYKMRTIVGTTFSEFSDYISAATVFYTVNINFNDGISPEPIPWNNTELLYNGYKLENLLNDNNQHTGISISVLQNFSGFNNWGMVTGNNSGIVSDNIMEEFYYVQYGETTQLMVEGLSFGYKYNFNFFGSCDERAIGTLIGLYTIGGKTVQLDARNNTQNTIQINNVEPDAQGRVIITIKSQAPGYAFVNSINIQPVPLNASQSEGGSSFRQTNNKGGQAGNLSALSEDESTIGRSEIVAAYPVPIEDDLMLRFLLEKPVDRLVASLLDNSGRILLSQEFRGLTSGKNERKFNINGRNLVQGVYFIRITGWSNGTSKIIRVVK
jgi:predicted esterase